VLTEAVLQEGAPSDKPSMPILARSKCAFDSVRRVECARRLERNDLQP
jgi:hypothetical protein